MDKHKLDEAQYPPKWDKKSSKLKIEISSIVNASETKQKVTKAIKNIFPDLEVTIDKENYLTGSTTNETVLFHFCELIYNQKILDVARKCILEGTSEESDSTETNKSIFYLNKQVASKNKVSFTTPDESPLGPIIIKIETEELELFINSYFPKYEWFK